MTKTPISAVVLTHESERTLEPTLASLQWCDEIVVVDSGSRDRTLEIAKKYQTRILNREFDGYSPQKQFGVDQAKHDWVFVVDSDEVVTLELQAAIREVFDPSASCPHVGFKVSLKLVFLGKLMKYAGTGTTTLRLFDRRQGAFDQAIVHEKIELKGTAGTLRGEILHYSYLTVEDYFLKFNGYTTFAARGLARVGKTPPFAWLWLTFPAHFIKRYIFELGFLDGYRGYLWSLWSALYPVVKYAKLIELRRRGEHS